MRKHIFAPLLLATLAAVLLSAAPAQATGPSHTTGTEPSAPGSFDPTPQLLGAELSGAQEVPTPGGPAVGDPDGKAKARVLLLGDSVFFSLKWSGISAPTAAHIHKGGKGVNGPIAVAFFGDPGIPGTATAAAGLVKITDPKLAHAIRKDPGAFYVNLHTAEFPGGAVRGQLQSLALTDGMVNVVRGGKLFALLSGDQEVPVPGGPAVGDPDGKAIGFVDFDKHRVDYSVAWIAVAPPTAVHIHEAPAGANGPIKVDLVTTPVPSSIYALAGSVYNVDHALVKKLKKDPQGFYLNLHTAEFPGGAVRGQLTFS